jgi:hypothetical protein
MWLQHQSKRQLRLEKAESKRNVALFVSWQNPADWLRHAGAKPREEVDYSAARQGAIFFRVAIVTVVSIRKRDAL